MIICLIIEYRYWAWGDPYPIQIFNIHLPLQISDSVTIVKTFLAAGLLSWISHTTWNPAVGNTIAPA